MVFSSELSLDRALGPINLRASGDHRRTFPAALPAALFP